MHYSKICLRHQLQGVRPKFFFYNCIKKITSHWSVPLHIQPLPYWQSFTSSYLGSLSRFHLNRYDDGRFFFSIHSASAKQKWRQQQKCGIMMTPSRQNHRSRHCHGCFFYFCTPRHFDYRSNFLCLRMARHDFGTSIDPTIRWDLSLDDVCWQPTYLPILVVLMPNFFVAIATVFLKWAISGLYFSSFLTFFTI